MIPKALQHAVKLPPPMRQHNHSTATRTQRTLALLITSLSFTASATAIPLELNYGGFVNGAFGAIGSTDPQYDALVFKDRTTLPLYFEDSLSYEQSSFYRVWENVTFNDPLAADRMSVSLLGTAFDSGDLDLDGGYVRRLRVSEMTLNNVDLDSYSVNLTFWGNNNSLTLNNSTMDLRFIEMLPQATAPMLLQVQSGSNKLTAWGGNISPTQFTLNIASGASLELFYSGQLGTNIPSQRVNFDTSIQGTIAGELFLHYSNVYMNSTDNLKFTAGSTLRLAGSSTFLEVEEISFEGSTINLGINTSFQINSSIELVDTDLTFGTDAVLNTDGTIFTKGTVNLDGTSPASGIRGKGLLHLNNLGGATQFNQQNISESVLDFLLIETGSELNLQDTSFVINQQLFATGAPDINLQDSTFRLNGFAGGNSSDFNIDIDSNSRFTIAERGTWQQNSSRTSNNLGSILVDGDFHANGTISGDGIILIREDGIMQFGNSNSTVHSFTTDNDLFFEPDLLPVQPSPDGGSLQVQLDVTGGSASNDRILYGNGDVTLTQMRALNVGLTKQLTADELDGQSFTLIQAQSSGVAGNLIDAASAPLVEGADIPALIDFTITDENTNTKPDLTLNAQKQGNNALLTHPSVTTGNQLGAAQLTTNAANNGNTAINNALNQLTNGQVGSHLNSIHPEPYSSYMTVSLEQADQIMNAVLSRGTGQRGVHSSRLNQQEDPRTRRQFWSISGYTDGEVDGSRGLGDFDYDLTHITLGQDLLTTNEGAAGGVYFNYSRQEMDEHDLAIQDIDGDQYHIGLYLSALQIQGMQIDALAGYAYGDHSSTRSTQLAGQPSRLKASYDSHSFYTGVRASLLAYANNWVRLYPEVGLNYTYYWQESFDESGDPTLALDVDSADAQAIIASVGIQAQFASLLQQTSLYPLAFLRYEHDFYANSNSQHDIDAGLVSQPGQKFRFAGQNRGQDIFSLGAGLGSELSDTLQVNAGIIYTDQSNGNELSAQLELSYLW